MSRKKRYIDQLSETELLALKKGHQNGKSYLFRRKCQCILLSHEGKSVTELREIYGVSANSIYQWFNRWESEGIDGLRLKPGRGRPVKLDLNNSKQVKRIKTLVENEPQNLNRVVSQLESELDIRLSKKTLQRFLKNLNTAGSDFADT